NKLQTLLGIMQTVPDSPDTMVIIESTANGYDEFKDLWDGAVSGENAWRPVFLPWYMEPEYRRPVEPGTEWTDEERALQKQYGLDEEQLTWRRWCIKTNCGGSVEQFHQEYPNTPDEAFLLSGDPYFDNGVIMARRQAAAEPVRRGLFVYDEPEIEGGPPRNWRFEDQKKGYIKIFEEPKQGHPYVLAGDTAGDGSDSFTVHVLDNIDGHQVAELKQPLSEILYARQIFCMGYYYNTGLIAIETNYSTYPEMKVEEWHYPKLYQRERFDTYTGQMVKAFGWVTSPKTRPVLLAGLHTVMEEAPELICSFDLLGEMLTFVYNKDRRPEAAPGEHDDLVMAAGIAHAVRDQQRYIVELPADIRSKWTEDMRQDYNAASEEERKIMREHWGAPN
ncbi:MAG: hypothetical protein MJ074_06635, partial [Oscillospiraceae bacterium]|nr:hypothetical protein [Oscillospiraceae bacterium]